MTTNNPDIKDNLRQNSLEQSMDPPRSRLLLPGTANEIKSSLPRSFASEVEKDSRTVFSSLPSFLEDDIKEKGNEGKGNPHTLLKKKTMVAGKKVGMKSKSRDYILS